jgi:hypothetical protein
VSICVPIAQSEAEVVLIVSFVRHRSLDGSQLMMLGSEDYELHFIKLPTKK